jgi:hypothetical protein
MHREKAKEKVGGGGEEKRERSQDRQSDRHRQRDRDKHDLLDHDVKLVQRFYMGVVGIAI